MAKSHPHLSFVFPGQGSQQIGMLKAFEGSSLVNELFNTASAAVGKNLWSIAQNGPAETLNDTVNTQPVLLTASVALWHLWQKETDITPKIIAGHSLGEYSALVCAQALSLSDAAALVALRGKLMSDAVPKGQGAMAAVLGMEVEELAQVCEEAAQGEIVAPVNLNAPGQIVIAGNVAAVERASALAKTKGAKKVIILPVSVPSHCLLMKDAASKLAKHLESVKIQKPQIPVIHNVNVEISAHPDDIRQCLVEQLYQPVRWIETVQRLNNEGIQFAVECGPGKVLCGLIKRTSPVIKPMGFEAPEELKTVLESLA